MARYNNLLTAAIAHIRQSHQATQTQNLAAGGARDFVLPKVSESPNHERDFDLVTWLVIKDAK